MMMKFARRGQSKVEVVQEPYSRSHTPWTRTSPESSHTNRHEKKVALSSHIVRHEHGASSQVELSSKLDCLYQVAEPAALITLRQIVLVPIKS